MGVPGEEVVRVFFSLEGPPGGMGMAGGAFAPTVL